VTLNPYVHQQFAHCESGVTSSLLTNAGLPVSEAMSFGIGSGIFFVYVPFVKVMGLPLTSFRSFPGGIFKKTCKRLDIPYRYQTFRNSEKGSAHGTQTMDLQLKLNQAMGVRTNIYWLPYIPKQFRFQFNGHNLVVYGKEGDDYLVSDPVLETASVCASKSMHKARFARGVLAPRGLLYYPVPKSNKGISAEQLKSAVYHGIKETAHRMLYTPLPFFGVRGVRYLSRQLAKWPTQLKDLDTQKLYLANVVRMQEEIGTGGAGFRYLYAAFLQESADLLENVPLDRASKKMTSIGNLWRVFATHSAKFCKDRLDIDYLELPKILMEIAVQEENIFKEIRSEYLNA
jgi:hypothetical protein